MSTSDRIVVFDVETTGCFPARHDRVVEIAVVRTTLDGTIEDEFVSLVNPERDIGPMSIHGLTSADILDAPTFAELAGDVAERLDDGVVYAGHNVLFDVGFLRSEFSRLDVTVPHLPLVCTMRHSGGGRLSECCCNHGIDPPDEAHSALDDARATALLLGALIRLQKLSMQPQRTAWPKLPKSGCQQVTRKEVRSRPRSNPYLQRLGELAAQCGSSVTDATSMAYLALLDRVLEDRRIDATEGSCLIATATDWGLTLDQVESLHVEFLRRLGAAALLDGVVTDAERTDLHQVAELLGRSPNDVDSVLAEAGQRLQQAGTHLRPVASDLTGKSVCFTGELQGTIDGELITREQAQGLARQAGLTIAASVTKKLDLLVVADPNTQSSKAKKARSYGTRVMAENVFWKAIGADVD